LGPQYFKYVAATAKLCVSEGWIEVKDIPKTPKYEAISFQIKFPSSLGVWIYGHPIHTSYETKL
jgi:hypothetical protein